MPSLFESRFEDVAMPMLETEFSVSVTFQVGTKSSEAFIAIGNDREYDSIELETGLPIKLTMRDWLLPVSSLVIAGTTIAPKAGNRITYGDEQFEVVPVQGKPAAELQEGGYRYLVHSQRITA